MGECLRFFRRRGEAMRGSCRRQSISGPRLCAWYFPFSMWKCAIGTTEDRGQRSDVRYQGSDVLSQVLTPSAFCFLPSAFCFLPPALNLASIIPFRFFFPIFAVIEGYVSTTAGSC